MGQQDTFNMAGQKPWRTLANPPVRREIRHDFPATIRAIDVDNILKTVQQQLVRHGTSLKEAGRITIAYPHKHPGLFPGHRDSATPVAHTLREKLRQKMPDIAWIVADGICETVHLARSENKTSIYALMGRQAYDFHQPSQRDYLPFLDASNDQTEYFITVDANYYYGTTTANMISFIEHNGGIALCNVAERTHCSDFFAQQEEEDKPDVSDVKLPAPFDMLHRNAKQLPKLSLAFSKSIRSNWTPARCIEAFEAALNKNGHSVFALTQGECQALINTMHEEDLSHQYMTFHSLLQKLNAGNGA